MAINKIEKFHLEESAYNLRQAGKSYRDIASELSGTSGTRITPNTVQRFFDTHDNIREELIQNIIERNDTIIATSITQSFDINSYRIRLTASLMELLNKKLTTDYQDGKEIAALAKEIREGLNDMDKNISPLIPQQGAMDYNIGATLTDDQLLAALKLTEPDTV